MDNWKVSEAWLTSIVLMFIPIGMMLRILFLRKKLKWLLGVPAVGVLWFGVLGLIGGMIGAFILLYFVIYPFSPPIVLATTSIGSAFFLTQAIRDRDASAYLNLSICLVSLALMTYVCTSLGRLTIPVSFNL